MAPQNKAAWHQLLAAIPVIYIRFSIGLATGWLAPTLASLKPNINLNDILWIASIHELGRICGALLTASLTDRIGRKIILIFSSFQLFSQWLGVLFMQSTPFLYIARFIFGISAGICDVVLPLYLVENYSPTIRNTFSNISTAIFYFGISIQFILSSYLPYRTVGIINLVNGSLGFFCTIFLIEPMRYLITKGRITAAQKTFAWLKGEDDWNAISTEFDTIRASTEIENERKTTLKNLFADALNRKKIIIIIIMNMLIMGTGWGAITAFWTILLPSAAYITSYTFTICIGLVQLIAVVIWLFIFNQYNEIHRRCTMPTGLILIGTAQLWMALRYSSSGAWITFFIMACLAFGYVPLNSFVQITGEEFFPRNATSNSIAIMAQAFIGFLTNASFFLISSYSARVFNFIIYSVISFVSLIYLGRTFPKPTTVQRREDRDNDFVRRNDNCLICGAHCLEMIGHCLIL